MEQEGFYTQKGYESRHAGDLTAAMEDYLEMIARISARQGSCRVGQLSRQLHVKASSVTKMVRQLAQWGLIDAPKYGAITLTPQGRAAGDYLLRRHEILHRFLCLVNQTQDELEQVEKIEHFLNLRTVQNLERLTLRLEQEGQAP